MKLPSRQTRAIWLGNSMHFFGWVMVLGLTGTFTVTLFAHYAPVQAPYLPVLALAVCELGVIHWQHFLKYNAKNMPQLLIAGLMLVLSILAIAFCTGLELTSMFILGGNIDQFFPLLRGSALIGLVLITILNVLAFALISISSPETLSRFARIAATPITMTVETYESQEEMVSDLSWLTMPDHYPQTLETGNSEQPIREEQETANNEQRRSATEQVGLSANLARASSSTGGGDKKEQVRTFLIEHPSATLTEMTKQLGVSRSYASTVRSQLNAEQLTREDVCEPE